MTTRSGIAVARFREPLGEGRRISCAQTIALAYADLAGLSEVQAMNLTAGFGGGMGKKQTCGVVTAMLMIAGLSEQGEKCREMMDAFETKTGSTMCRELLEKHTEEYCPSLVRFAAELMEKNLSGQGDSRKSVTST